MQTTSISPPATPAMSSASSTSSASSASSSSDYATSYTYAAPLKSAPLQHTSQKRPRTPHSIYEAPWSPVDLDARIDATLGGAGAARASWWRLYADTVRLRQAGGGADNNSSRAVYRAVNCWAAAAGVTDRAERVALFRCYHDDDAVAALGYARRYGELMWELCEAEEKEREARERWERERGVGGTLVVARTW
jgi:hypothetical protein